MGVNELTPAYVDFDSVSAYVNTLSCITRHYPLYSGCGTLANSKMFPSLGGGRAIVIARLRCGLELFAPADDFIGRSVYFFGNLNPKLTWLFKRVLRAGDTVLDIGANLGLMSLHAHNFVKGTGRVIAIEPQPRLVGLLRASLARNQIENIEVHETALGEKNSKMVLSVPGINRGSASLVRTLDDVDETFLVKVRRTSDLLNEIHAGHCRLVKIDVEGFEAEVVAGAMDYWRECPPDVIVFEFNSNEEFTKSTVFRLLASLDYRFFAMPKRIGRPTLKPIPLSVPGAFVGHDVVANLTCRGRCVLTVMWLHVLYL